MEYLSYFILCDETKNNARNNQHHCGRKRGERNVFRKGEFKLSQFILNLGSGENCCNNVNSYSLIVQQYSSGLSQLLKLQQGLVSERSDSGINVGKKDKEKKFVRKY